MPNKTIYVSDGDLSLYQRAQELAGGNLSAAISAALRRYVDVEEGRARASTRSSSGSGPGKGRKVRFTGVLLGEWVNSSFNRVETFRVYRGRTGKFVLHTERSPDYTMVDAEGKPAGWRGYLGIGNVSYGNSPGESTLEVVATLEELRATHPATALRHGRRAGPATRGGGARHLTRRRGAVAGEVRHDTRTRPDRDPRDRACASRSARRSSSTASTSRSPRAPSSPCSDRTAPARRPWSGSCRR